MRPLLQGNTKDHFALRGKFDGVTDQVDDDLPQTSHITDQPIRDVGLHLIEEFQSLAVCRDGERFHGLAQTGTQGKPTRIEFQLPRLDLREIQEIIDDPEEGFRRRFDEFEIFTLFHAQFRAKGQFCHAQDAVHWGTNFVADIGEKFTLAAVGGFRCLFRRLQGRFCLLALRDVPRDPHHPNDLPLTVTEH